MKEKDDKEDAPKVIEAEEVLPKGKKDKKGKNDLEVVKDDKSKKKGKLEEDSPKKSKKGNKSKL